MKKTLLTFILAGTCMFLNAQNRVAKPSETKNARNSSALHSVALHSNPSLQSGAVACDTISNFLSTYTPTVFLDQGGGYVSGQNSYSDQSKADIYSVSANSVIDGAIYFFGVGTTSGTGQKFQAVVWDDDGAGGLPMTMLGSDSISYDSAAADVSALTTTYADFNPDIPVSGIVYVGVNFGYNAGDTIAVITSADAEPSVNTAYEQFDTGDWYPFDDATNSWGLTVANAIFPVVCTAVGIQQVLTPGNKLAVFPNPSTQRVFNIVVPEHNVNEPVTVKVYDAKSVLIFNDKINAASDLTYKLNLKNASKGTYTLQVETSGSVKTQKITIL